MKIKLLAFSILVTLSISSARADQSWGVHAPHELVKILVPSESSYEDFISFSINKIENLKATELNNLNTTDGNYVFLFNDDTGEEIGSESYSFSNSSTFNYLNLPSGNYIYDIYGFNSRMQKGEVNFSSEITNPVSEPETYAMLLAGIGLINFMSRRRSSSKFNGKFK